MRVVFRSQGSRKTLPWLISGSRNLINVVSTCNFNQRSRKFNQVTVNIYFCPSDIKLFYEPVSQSTTRGIAQSEIGTLNLTTCVVEN